MSGRSGRKMFVRGEVDTWPEVRLTLYPLPWTWHVTRFYWFDDLTYSFTLRLGPFGVEMWTN